MSGRLKQCLLMSAVVLRGPDVALVKALWGVGSRGTTRLANLSFAWRWIPPDNTGSPGAPFNNEVFEVGVPDAVDSPYVFTNRNCS